MVTANKCGSEVAPYPKGKPRVSPVVGSNAGLRTREEDNALVGSTEAAFASQLLNFREGGAMVRGKTR